MKVLKIRLAARGKLLFLRFGHKWFRPEMVRGFGPCRRPKMAHYERRHCVFGLKSALSARRSGLWPNLSLVAAAEGHQPSDWGEPAAKVVEKYNKY